MGIWALIDINQNFYKLVIRVYMQNPINFIRFEIEQRTYSPNTVMGITDTGKRIMVATPATDLGKQLGDKIALQIKAALEREYLSKDLMGITQYHRPVIECPHCKELQTHGFPMNGKLYCRSCGELLDHIERDELELLSCPGDTIKETLEKLGIDIPLFVIKMQISNKEAARLLKGYTPITPEIAAKLQEIFNIDAQFWLNMEANYRAKLEQLTKQNP